MFLLFTFVQTFMLFNIFIKISHLNPVISILLSTKNTTKDFFRKQTWHCAFISIPFVSLWISDTFCFIPKCETRCEAVHTKISFSTKLSSQSCTSCWFVIRDFLHFTCFSNLRLIIPSCFYNLWGHLWRK